MCCWWGWGWWAFYANIRHSDRSSMDWSLMVCLRPFQLEESNRSMMVLLMMVLLMMVLLLVLLMFLRHSDRSTMVCLRPFQFPSQPHTRWGSQQKHIMVRGGRRGGGGFQAREIIKVRVVLCGWKVYQKKGCSKYCSNPVFWVRNVSHTLLQWWRVYHHFILYHFSVLW